MIGHWYAFRFAELWFAFWFLLKQLQTCSTEGEGSSLLQHICVRLLLKDQNQTYFDDVQLVTTPLDFLNYALQSLQLKDHHMSMQLVELCPQLHQCLLDLLIELDGNVNSKPVDLKCTLLIPGKQSNGSVLCTHNALSSSQMERDAVKIQGKNPNPNSLLMISAMIVQNRVKPVFFFSS